jgi:hypothetical protein
MKVVNNRVSTDVVNPLEKPYLILAETDLREIAPQLRKWKREFPIIR